MFDFMFFNHIGFDQNQNSSISDSGAGVSADFEAGGLCAVCGHRCAVPAAGGGRLELSVPV